MPKKIIRIGSRESCLAIAQTKLVMNAIKKAQPQIQLELVTMKTTGDKILDRSLEQIGGKGLFVKELDRALLDGRIDLSIHSLKDMPMETPKELPIIAYFQRGDPRDCLIYPISKQIRQHDIQSISGTYSFNLKGPAGCSGNRRKVQLRNLFGSIEVKGIRGNILTRLEKLDGGEYGALVFACAGLERMQLTGRMNRIFTTDEMIPSAGQGTLAVQGRAGEDFPWINEINDPITRISSLAERQFVRILDGGCSSPIAAYAETHGEELLLKGLFCHAGSEDYITGNITGNIANALQLGEELAKQLSSKI